MAGGAQRAWTVAREGCEGVWLLLTQAAREFRHDGCVRHAAATSYFAILSFIPFVVLLLSGVGYVLGAVGSSREEEARLLEGILRTTQEIAPFLEQDVRERLKDVVGARETFGLIGAVVLLMTSSLVFGAVEDAVSGIFRRQRRRHLVISKLLFLAFIATFGVILLLGRWVLALADTLLTVAGATALTDGIVSSPVVGVAMSFVGNALAFGVLVRYFGSVRVTYRHLLAGATLFFLLWEGAKHVFMLYLRYVARFSVLYGSVSTVMVLVVWIFYTVCIFLYCAEVVKLMTGPGPGDAVRSGSAV